MMDGATSLTGWTVTANPPSVDLELDASATVALSGATPTDAAALAPTLKVDLDGWATVQSAFTVANQLTINIPAGTGTGTHTGLPGINAPIRLHAGAKIVFHNADGITHVIHGNGGIPHENTAAGQAGTDYMVSPTADATWYCHSHEGGGMARPVLVAQ